MIQWDNNGVFCWDTMQRGGCNGNRMEYQWEMNEISIGGKKRDLMDCNGILMEYEWGFNGHLILYGVVMVFNGI